MRQKKAKPETLPDAEKNMKRVNHRWTDIFAAIGHPTVILDKDHHILAANRKVVELTGISEEALHNKKCYEVFHSPGSNGSTVGCPLEKLKKSGHLETMELEMEVLGGYYLVSCTPVKDSKGNLESIIHIATDITERKSAEEKIKRVLDEKEILLKEIHHRVKNNLQIIISLLNLQADKISDSEALIAFDESRNRISSMALVHELLYESKDFSHIDFKNYVEMMIKKLFISYEISGQVKLDIKINKVNLGIDAIIPCGLMLNEMVTNSLKHAFPNQEKGQLSIKMQSVTNNKYQLTYSDNGVGFPKDIDFYSFQSLGVVLIKVLTQQLGGNIEIFHDDGTRYEIVFTG